MSRDRRDIAVCGCNIAVVKLYRLEYLGNFAVAEQSTVKSVQANKRCVPGELIVEQTVRNAVSYRQCIGVAVIGVLGAVVGRNGASRFFIIIRMIVFLARKNIFYA